MGDDLDDRPMESSAVKADRFFSGDLFSGIEEDEEEQVQRKSKKMKAEKDAIEDMNAEFEQATGGPGKAAKSNKRKKQPDWESEDEDELLDNINKEDAKKQAEFAERTKLLPKKEQDLAETLA